MMRFLILIGLLAGSSLLGATGDVPYKVQNSGGTYDNRSLPTDVAIFAGKLSLVMPILSGSNTFTGTNLFSSVFSVLPSAVAGGSGANTTIAGGNNSGAGGIVTAGSVIISGGTTTGTGSIFSVGGSATLQGGSANGASGAQRGGPINITGGSATTTAGTRLGGSVTITGGSAIPDSTGGSVNINSGGTGGSVFIGTASNSPVEIGSATGGLKVYNAATTTRDATGSAIYLNIRHGKSAALVAGVLVVADTACTSNTRYYFTTHTRGTITLPASYDAATRSVGVSFTITSSQTTDTSTVDWMAIEP